jgi:PhnB protein
MPTKSSKSKSSLKNFKSDEPPVLGYVVVADFDEAAKFYSKVFGAKDERFRDPSGKTWFAQMGLLGHRLLLMEPMKDMQLVARQRKILTAAGGDSSMLSLDVPNVDEVFKTAIKAGATAIIEPYDAHWGDRYAEFRDPFGHRWACCQTLRDLTIAEKQKALTQFIQEHGNLKSPAAIVKAR